MMENKTSTVTLEQLFLEAEQMLENAGHLPLMNRVLLDENEWMDILDKLHAAIPKAVKSAEQVIKEQNNILSKAYADSDRIVEEAKAEAERILAAAEAEAEAKLQQEEIVREANAYAEQMRSEATSYRQEVMSAADDYAFRSKQEQLEYSRDMFNYFSNILGQALTQVDETKNSIEGEIRNLKQGVNYHNADVEEFAAEEE